MGNAKSTGFAMNPATGSAAQVERVRHDTFQALLALSATAAFQKSCEPLRLMLSAGNVDWQELLRMAESHRTMPLVVEQLSRVADLVPTEASELLRQAAVETLRTNTALASELLRVSAHFRSARILHLAYKGPVLAQRLYGNVAARITSDLDIVVPPDRVAAARDALAQLGYQDKNGLSKSQQAASFRYGFEHSFCSANGTTVDLHWRTVHPWVSRSLDIEGVWQRASSVKLFGQEVPTFADEDLLMVLCLHAGQHEWSWLGGIVDIAQLLSLKPDMNWGIVYSQLRDSNTLRIVAVSLWLARKIWGVELPDKMLRIMAQDIQASAIADEIQDVMWPSCECPTSFRWAMERSRGERLRDRVRFLWLFLNPTMADFEGFRVPSWLIWAYPLLRVLRLLGKYSHLTRPSRSSQRAH
jgi:Uncharacterised nucleotidyltransferase